MATAPVESPRPGHAACSGCALCLLPCPVWRETHDPELTLMGRAKALQGGAAAVELRDSLQACVLCGACEPVCPEGIDTVGMTLRLRAELAGGGALPLAEAVAGLLRRAPEPRVAASTAPTLLLPGAALAEEPRLVEVMVRLLGGGPAAGVAGDDGRDLALALEAGLEPDRERERRFLEGLGGARTLVVAEGLLQRFLRERMPRARVIGVGEALLRLPAVRQGLRAGDLLLVEPRGYHADFERLVRFYDGVRRETGCLLNFDLHRIAIPTGAASAQARSGRGGLDVAGQIRFLLEGRGVERVVVEDLRDRAACAEAAGLPAVHLAELA